MKELLILMVGPAGSGKSTMAKHIASLNNALIISRDDIRSMLFGLKDEDHYLYYKSYFLGRNEQVVTAIQNAGIRAALDQSRPVIVDNTNLKEGYIKQFDKIAEEYETKADLVFVDATLEECLERNLQRDRVVDEGIIRKQYEDYKKIREKYEHRDKIRFNT